MSTELESAHVLPVNSPVHEPERIASLDILRGFAILGILPMNIQAYSMIGAAYMNPTAYGDLSGANYWVWQLSHILCDDKFIALLSMLFGAGVFLMTSRAAAAGRSVAALHYRRMGWLLLFGLMHAYLFWAGDILYSYAMCGLLLYPFRKCKPRTLLILGGLTLAIGAGIMVMGGLSMPYWPKAEVDGARGALWSPTARMVADEIARERGGWIAQIIGRAPDTFQLQTFYFAISIFWRVFGFMLLGMGLFQCGWFSAKLSTNSYRWMVALAAFVGAPLIAYGSHQDFAHSWDFRYSMFFGEEYNYWGSLLVTAGWLGVIMLLERSPRFGGLKTSLAAVGRMAFSNYILQTLICTTIFNGHGLALFGRVERTLQFAIVVAIWSAQIILSPLWLRLFYFGPLEWLWRSLTYWEWEPFQR